MQILVLVHYFVYDALEGTQVRACNILSGTPHEIKWFTRNNLKHSIVILKY